MVPSTTPTITGYGPLAPSPYVFPPDIESIQNDAELDMANAIGEAQHSAWKTDCIQGNKTNQGLLDIIKSRPNPDGIMDDNIKLFESLIQDCNKYD